MPMSNPHGLGGWFHWQWNVLEGRCLCGSRLLRWLIGNCNGEELMIKLIYVCMVGINWRLCICEVMRIP